MSRYAATLRLDLGGERIPVGAKDPGSTSRSDVGGRDECAAFPKLMPASQRALVLGVSAINNSWSVRQGTRMSIYAPCMSSCRTRSSVRSVFCLSDPVKVSS